MNNINELYTQLSTSMPERKEPVRSLKEGVGSQEIPDISSIALLSIFSLKEVIGFISGIEVDNCVYNSLILFIYILYH